MSQTTIPRTPTPESIDDSDVSPIASPTRSKSLRSASNGRLSAAMTPPPSTQIPSYHSRAAHSRPYTREDQSLASPPPTLRSEPPISSGALYGEVPTMNAVEGMNEAELRNLVAELLPALREARVSVAHTKLQHNLLKIETEESIQRAEVEHEATKREVQVLQEGSPGLQNAFSPIASPQASSQRSLQVALSHCRELQQENVAFDRRLTASRKWIAQLDSQVIDLKEKNQMLLQRIKDNRDHMNELQDSGAVSLNATPRYEFGTPNVRDTPRTPATRRIAEDLDGRMTARHTPLDVLVEAANGVASSPGSPSLSRQRKWPNHTRGAYSLSSLSTTPHRRPMTAEATMTTPSRRIEQHPPILSAPSTQLNYEPVARPRDDREDTISVSDNGDDIDQDEDLPGSQASQAASQMLRRSLEKQAPHSQPSKQPLSPTPLKQGKLFGKVTKPGGLGSKRPAGDDLYDDSLRSSKLQKTARRLSDGIGLGIGSWHDPAP